MTWFIALFGAPADAEAMVGDLREERLAIAAQHGERYARWWLWQQLVRTVAHVAIWPLRQAPWTFLLLGALGFWLVLPFAWAAFWLAGQVAVRAPVYAYLPATSFWFSVSVLPYLAVGALAAGLLGRRAMSGALAVLVSMFVFIVVIDPIRLATVLPPQRLPGAVKYFSHVLPGFTTYALAVLVSTGVGVMIRQRHEARQTGHGASVQ